MYRIYSRADVCTTVPARPFLTIKLLLENNMIYDVEIDLEDLGISTEDLVSLAVYNGDQLFDQDDLDCRIEEALADANSDLKETIKSLEEEIADLKIKAVDLDAIAHYVEIALRVEGIGIANCIRRGDYGV